MEEESLCGHPRESKELIHLFTLELRCGHVGLNYLHDCMR